MSPEYLEDLADLADFDQHWKLSGLDQRKLTPEQVMQLDTGVALRRYAAHRRQLLGALDQAKSLLITPLSPNGTAPSIVDTPNPRYHKQQLERLIASSQGAATDGDGLPPLPKPEKFNTGYGIATRYTADQMRAYALESIRLAAIQAGGAGWVPVTERLPDDSQHGDVLCWVPFTQGGGCKCFYQYWHADDDGPAGKCWQEDGVRLKEYLPTHWQPLPPPPPQAEAPVGDGSEG